MARLGSLLALVASTPRYLNKNTVCYGTSVYLSNSSDNDVKEALIKNGEGLSPQPGRCPVGEQCSPSRHQTTTRTKWAKDDYKLQSIVILKQRKVKGNIGNGCTNTVEKSADLRLRSTENKKTDARK